VIEEDALPHSSELVEGLQSRYDLRIVRRSTGAFLRRRTVLRRELSLLIRLLLARNIYRRGSLLIGGSGPYATLAVARILAAVGFRRNVFLYNFYIHQLGENALVKTVLRLLFTGRVVVAAQSQVDLDYFRSLSASVRLVVVPYGQGPVPGIPDAAARLGDYVFAGGFSNRDYDRLLRCARMLPTVPFLIACSSLNTFAEEVPGNVEVVIDLAPAPFHELLAGARLVVIPLAEDVGSSGQMVALAAMQFGKALLVSNSAVVTQYIDQGVTGLVYDRISDASLLDSLKTAVEDEPLLVRLGAAARSAYAERFTKSAYDRSLLDALEVAFPTPPPLPSPPFGAETGA
jgi:glycosyltransferase involved in cell wall biosynthesis